MAKPLLEESRHLTLTGLAPEPRLARRLPAELARRFHALPLAEDCGRITVAMADPNDPVAREAIAAALGATACVVRGDAEAIDALLAQIWGEQATRSPEVLVCAAPTALPPPVVHYVQALSSLLEARLDWLALEEGLSGPEGPSTPEQHDLCLFADPAHPWLRRLLSTPGKGSRQPEGSRYPQAALVVGEPRWPIARILLVLCGEERDSAAVDWVLQLAHRAHSRVTVLAVVPPVPAMYGRRPGIGDGLQGLLTANSPLGQQIRQVARHLVAWEIEATLRLREGPPDVQIRRELAQGDYDLVAVAGRPCRGIQRWLLRDGAGDPLKWTNRPLLITR